MLVMELYICWYICIEKKYIFDIIKTELQITKEELICQDIQNGQPLNTKSKNRFTKEQ